MSFLVSLALSRSLGASDFGIYAYCFGVMTFLAVPVQTGLTSILVREVARSAAAGTWSLLRGIVRRSRQLVLSYFLLVAIGSASFIALWSPAAAWITTFAIGLLILPVLALNGIHTAVLNGLGRTLTGQLLESVLRPLLFVLMLGAMLLTSAGVLTPVSAMAGHWLAFALVLLVSYLTIARALPREAAAAAPTFDDGAWARSLGVFIMLAGAQMLTQHADFLVLGLFAGSADVGVYRVASQTALLVGLPLAAINLGLAPLFSRLHAEGRGAELERAVRAGGRTALAFSLIPAIALIFFGERLLGLVFGEEFARGATLLTILVGAQLVNCVAGPVGLLMNMTGHERYTFAAFAASAVTNTGATFVLTPLLGLEGAALSNALGVAVWNLVLTYLARRRLGISTTPLQLSRADTRVRMPNFFIIGAPKCGTTSLTEWLREHPAVFMPILKEPQFYNLDHDYVFPRLTANEYRGLFRNATDRQLAIGESSTWYLHSEVAVPAILRDNPEAKFIVCLRNPVEMVQSLHQHLVTDLEEPLGDFATAWRARFARARTKLPRTHPFLDYGEVCKLGRVVGRLLELVPRERVLIVLMDDLRRAPRAEYERILAFLGVPDDGRMEFPSANPARANRSPAFTRLLRGIGTLKARARLPAFGLGLLDWVRALNTVPASRQRLSPALERELQDHFREDVELLSRIIGRDLRYWLHP